MQILNDCLFEREPIIDIFLDENGDELEAC
jgi:hypothetical protein